MSALGGMLMTVDEFHDFIMEQREKAGVISQTTPLHLHQVYDALEKLSSKNKDISFDGKTVDYNIFKQYMLEYENPIVGPMKSQPLSTLSDKQQQVVWAKKFSVSKEDVKVISGDMSDKQKLFWNTTFSKKQGKFGSEPRSKVLRGMDTSVKQDDGYLVNAYAKNNWRQKNRDNAIQPRPQIVSTFGTLTSIPGPGEYEKVSTGFEHSSRFQSGPVPTVKGRGTPKKETMPTKTPRHLLSMKTPQEDSFTRIKRRIRQKHKEEQAKAEKDQEEPDELDPSLIKKDPFVAKIQRWHIDKIRSTLDDLEAVPGPNAYPNSLKPFQEDKMNVGMPRGPTMAQLKGPSKAPRTIIDMKNDGRNFERDLKFSTPGVGSYDLRGRLDEPSTLPSRGASPVTKIHPESPLSSPSKLASGIGPGSYDVITGMNMTSGFNKVARSYQKADFGASHSRREFE